MANRIGFSILPREIARCVQGISRNLVALKADLELNKNTGLLHLLSFRT